MRPSRMAIAWPLAVFNGLLLTACATSPGHRIQDAHGVASVTIPSHWVDNTADHMDEVSRAQSFGKLRRDSGIRMLMVVKSQRSPAQCKFRELTYTLGELGYEWPSSRLAAEVAAVRNQVIATHSPADYIRLGVPIAMRTFSAFETQKVDDKPILIGMREGWAIRHVHTLKKPPSAPNTVVTWTIVLPLPGANVFSNAKRQLVVECATEGTRHMQDGDEEDISAVVQSIQVCTRPQAC